MRSPFLQPPTSPALWILHMKESFGIFPSSAYRPAMFPLSSELPLKGIARTFLCLPINRVGDIRVFASQLESLWWLLCPVENKMLYYCVRGRLCVCHHFVLDLISSRSNPAPSCHFISCKCTSPATTTTKKTKHQNLIFLFHHWVCGLPFPFCSSHLRTLADFSRVSGRHCAAS